LQYTVPMYPGVLPFVDVEDWRPYAVFTDSKTGDFVNGANGKIISKVQVLTNPEEIAGWYRKNLGHKCVGGSYIRPTYLTDGKVTLYNQNGPNTFDILRQQLEAMKLSEAQIRAHLHTVRDRNLWLQVPYDKRGDAATMEGLSRIRKEGRTAPEITEQKDVTIYRADMVSQLSYHPDRVLAGLVRAALAYANADHAVWKEIDFLLHHSAPAAAEVENKDTKSDSKASSPPADSKSQLGQGVASPAPPRRAFDPKSGAQGVFDRQAAALVTAVASELASDKPLNSGAFDPATVFPSSVGGKFSASSASVLAKAPKPANQLGEHKGVAQAVGARPQQPAIDPELDEIFECPILLCPMKAPTFVTPCGHTFERSAIEEVKAKGAACPLCAGPIQNLVTNFLVRDLIRRSAS
jgi:hypothetical protein